MFFKGEHKLSSLWRNIMEESNMEKIENGQMSKNNLILLKEEIMWLASGERGISSDTLFTYITGVNALGGRQPGVPLDLDDLRRCRLLLKRCPRLNEELYKIESVSSEWKYLIERWYLLCSSMDDEFRNWEIRDYTKSDTRKGLILTSDPEILIIQPTGFQSHKGLILTSSPLPISAVRDSFNTIKV
jgi:hypothetical protein